MAALREVGILEVHRRSKRGWEGFVMIEVASCQLRWRHAICGGYEAESTQLRLFLDSDRFGTSEFAPLAMSVVGCLQEQQGFWASIFPESEMRAVQRLTSCQPPGSTPRPKIHKHGLVATPGNGSRGARPWPTLEPMQR